MAHSYTEVTNQIIAFLEHGVKPWVREWDDDFQSRPLRHDGTPYKGINVVNLWAASIRRGFKLNHWMTYKQAQALGAQVQKGAKSEYVFYYGTGSSTDEKEEDNDENKFYHFLRHFRVFNVEEITGLDPSYYATPKKLGKKNRRNSEADTFITNTGARIIHGGDKAYYSPSQDLIRLPEFSSFKHSAHYYGTAFHELNHWTARRVDRQGKIYDNSEYAFEELVAELGAAFLSADLKMSIRLRENHASYIDHWLKALRADTRAIFQAARHAEKSCAYLHALQEVEDPGLIQQQAAD